MGRGSIRSLARCHRIVRRPLRNADGCGDRACALRARITHNHRGYPFHVVRADPALRAVAAPPLDQRRFAPGAIHRHRRNHGSPFHDLHAATNQPRTQLWRKMPVEVRRCARVAVDLIGHDERNTRPIGEAATVLEPDCIGGPFDPAGDGAGMGTTRHPFQRGSRGERIGRGKTHAIQADNVVCAVADKIAPPPVHVVGEFARIHEQRTPLVELETKLVGMVVGGRLRGPYDEQHRRASSRRDRWASHHRIAGRGQIQADEAAPRHTPENTRLVRAVRERDAATAAVANWR